MKKFIIMATAVAFGFGMANAIVVQTVTLRNGTVLNGYIQQQDRKDNITFKSDNAVIKIDGDNVSVNSRSYNESDLDSKWIKWAEENDAFEGTAPNRMLVLNDLSFGDSSLLNDTVAVIEGAESVDETYNKFTDFERLFREKHFSAAKVKVLEKGSKIKYLEMSPNTYTFNWKDVVSVKSDRRHKNALSGVDRKYVKKSSGREVSGQYAGESYNTVSVYTPDGMIETIDLQDVSNYKISGINPNQSIFEQSELLDIVRTKNGIFKGIITERDYSPNNKFLVIQESSGSGQRIPFANVIDYSKEENRQYAPKFDILLGDGEFVVNREPSKWVNVVKKGQRMYLDSINKNLVIPRGHAGTKVIIEFNNPSHISPDRYMLVMVEEDMDKKKKKEVFSFSTDLFEMRKYEAVNNETSVNNTTALTYDLPREGIYAFYDLNQQKVIPFIVK